VDGAVELSNVGSHPLSTICLEVESNAVVSAKTVSLASQQTSSISQSMLQLITTQTSRAPSGYSPPRRSAWDTHTPLLAHLCAGIAR
jgi:hypothetical protein